MYSKVREVDSTFSELRFYDDDHKLIEIRKVAKEHTPVKRGADFQRGMAPGVNTRGHDG